MIPLRDTIQSKNVPVINYFLIGLNVVFFMVQLMHGAKMGALRLEVVYGLVPARYTMSEVAAGFSLFQQGIAFVSYMFLHGGFLHLFFNMLSLYIFGDNVEDRLGPLRYAIFYLLCGVISGLTHLALNAHSTAPTIGASGAVAGVMGAYFLLHPRARILTLIPIIIIPWIMEIPAFIFIGIWFLIQVLNVFGMAGESNIAWGAHIGGFLCGILLIKLSLALPTLGATAPLRKATARRRSHRFQMARPTAADLNMDIHAPLVISPIEAMRGTHKIVTIPHGRQRRIFRVNVPPGMESGKRLRLKGQGGVRPDGQRGDIILQVAIN